MSVHTSASSESSFGTVSQKTSYDSLTSDYHAFSSGSPNTNGGREIQPLSKWQFNSGASANVDHSLQSSSSFDSLRLQNQRNSIGISSASSSLAPSPFNVAASGASSKLGSMNHSIFPPSLDSPWKFSGHLGNNVGNSKHFPGDSFSSSIAAPLPRYATSYVGGGVASSSPPKSSSDANSPINMSSLLISSTASNNPHIDSSMSSENYFDKDHYAPSTMSSGGAKIDPSTEASFRKMSKQLMAKEAEITELRQQLEALVTAVAVSQQSPSSSFSGTKELNAIAAFDSQEMAHNIVVRLRSLKEENQQLGKMLTQGRAAQKEVEIALLKRENLLLKTRLEELERNN